MTSLPVEVLLYIESSPEQRSIILLFGKDSLENIGIVPILKKVHVFFRNPVVMTNVMSFI